MPSFKDIISVKKHAEIGDLKRKNKLGGLTIDFSGQRFTQRYLDSFMEHIEASKVIERFVSIYYGTLRELFYQLLKLFFLT